MEHHRALVLSNQQIARDYYELIFAWPEQLPPPEPGQFLTVRVSETAIPLLRRPFAISRYDARKQEAGFIFQKRGLGTSILSSVATGETVDMLVPLGNRFPLPPNGKRPVLVAGGVGMGPIFYFADALRKTSANPLLILGARNVAYVPPLGIIDRVDTVICTDDGSRGFPGTVVDYLREHHPPIDEEVELYGCGPDPMLKALSTFAEERSCSLWLSLEQTMGCAVGACMGCAIRVTGPAQYARVCTEGPVFNAQEVIWE